MSPVWLDIARGKLGEIVANFNRFLDTPFISKMVQTLMRAIMRVA